jgi:membrane protease YdiL (CAAX protease family)
MLHSMLHPVDHVLAVLLAIAWPLYEAVIGYPRLKRRLAAAVPGARRNAYLQAILLQWTFVAVVLFVWRGFDRPLAALGLSAPSGAGFAIGAALVIALGAFLSWQYRAVIASATALDRVRAQLGEALPILPHTPGELRGFLWLSATAGVCEEILFRGFMITYLGVFVGFAGAVFLSTLIFGVAHSYLGRSGAIKATLAGLVMAGLYALTHSLWAPMVAHAIVDMNSGRLGHRAITADGGTLRAA